MPRLGQALLWAFIVGAAFIVQCSLAQRVIETPSLYMEFLGPGDRPDWIVFPKEPIANASGVRPVIWDYWAKVEPLSFRETNVPSNNGSLQFADWTVSELSDGLYGYEFVRDLDHPSADGTVTCKWIVEGVLEDGFRNISGFVPVPLVADTIKLGWHWLGYGTPENNIDGELVLKITFSHPVNLGKSQVIEEEYFKTAVFATDEYSLVITQPTWAVNDGTPQQLHGRFTDYLIDPVTLGVSTANGVLETSWGAQWIYDPDFSFVLNGRDNKKKDSEEDDPLAIVLVAAIVPAAVLIVIGAVVGGSAYFIMRRRRARLLTQNMRKLTTVV